MTDQIRYPVAERNRRAKLKFLEGMKTHYENKRKVSVESIPSGDDGKTMAAPKLDLSVPGTPVSSRYLRLRRESETEITASQKPATLPNEIVISSLVIDKFLKEMKSLSTDEPEEQHAEIVQVESDNADSDQSGPDEVTQQYFKESEQKQAYQRTFSEAVQTLYSSEVKSPVVKRYFEESSAKQSYARDFNEAVNEFNPLNIRDDPLKDDTAASTKGYKPSVPGTPINSKHLNKFKKKNYISDSSDDESENEVATPNRNTLADPLETFIKEMEALQASRPPHISEAKRTRDKQFSVGEYLNASESTKTYARTFSQAAQTLYTTEVKDPAIKEYFDKSEATKTFRREFSEAYQEIRREDLPIPEQPKPTVCEPKKVTQSEPVKYESLEELFGTYELPKLEKKPPPQNDFCVNSYMSSSDAKKSYARSFSEAAQTLHTSDVKNPAVRQYFDQSEAKQSFRREFSEVYQEVNVKEITRDIIPTEPTSSDQPKDNEPSENTISRSSATVALAVESSHKPPPSQRSISVPGTPISSKKLNPKEKSPRTVEPKPESMYAKTDLPLSPRLHIRKQRGMFNVEHYFAARLFRRARSVTDDPEAGTGGGLNDDKLFSLAGDGTSMANRTGSQSDMTAVEHAENATSASVRVRAASAAENNMEREFWKSFAAS